MSIIIGVISKNNQLFLGADTRAILPSDKIDDDYDKIFKIRPDLYFGITGIAEYGLAIKDRLLMLPDINQLFIVEIIQYLDSIYTDKHSHSTVLLSGRLETNQAFIWNKNTLGENRLIKSDGLDTLYSINSNDNTEFFEKRFVQEVGQTNFDFIMSIRNTIEYASTIDHTISSTCKIVCL